MEPIGVLDAAEVVLDPAAAAIEALGTVAFLCSVAAARDDRQGTFVLDPLAYIGAIVSLVRCDGERRPGDVEQFQSADELAGGCQKGCVSRFL